MSPRARAPQQEKLLHPATKSSPCSLELEKARMQMKTNCSQSLKKKTKNKKRAATSLPAHSGALKRRGDNGIEVQQRQCHSGILEHPGFLNPAFMPNHQTTNNISNLVSHKVSKCGPRTSSISTTWKHITRAKFLGFVPNPLNKSLWGKTHWMSLPYVKGGGPTGLGGRKLKWWNWIHWI